MPGSVTGAHKAHRASLSGRVESDARIGSSLKEPQSWVPGRRHKTVVVVWFLLRTVQADPDLVVQYRLADENGTGNRTRYARVPLQLLIVHNGRKYQQSSTSYEDEDVEQQHTRTRFSYSARLQVPVRDVRHPLTMTASASFSLIRCYESGQK